MRAAIVLAAGLSRRFGRHDKLQVRLAGYALLGHVLANARSSGASRVILVAFRPARYRNVTTVRARNARQGLSASLAAGLAALRPIEREVLIFLADMPFARAPRMVLTAGVDAVRPHFRAISGHPMLVRAAVARKSLGRGDTGLAGAVDPAFVRGTIGNIIDIDTRKALRNVRLHGSGVAGRRCRPA
jgi:molybdenum cofactor cytidylyltransferase